MQLFFKSKTIYNKNNWGLMSTTERGQRQTENRSPGTSPTPGMHGTLKRNNVHEDDLTHQEYREEKKKQVVLFLRIILSI